MTGTLLHSNEEKLTRHLNTFPRADLGDVGDLHEGDDDVAHDGDLESYRALSSFASARDGYSQRKDNGKNTHSVNNLVNKRRHKGKQTRTLELGHTIKTRKGLGMRHHHEGDSLHRLASKNWTRLFGESGASADEAVEEAKDQYNMATTVLGAAHKTALRKNTKKVKRRPPTFELDPKELMEGYHYVPSRGTVPNLLDGIAAAVGATKEGNDNLHQDDGVSPRLPVIYPTRFNYTVWSSFASVVNAEWSHPVDRKTGVGPEAVSESDGGVTVIGNWPDELTELSYIPILKNAHTALSNAVGDLRQRVGAKVDVLKRTRKTNMKSERMDSIFERPIMKPSKTFMNPSMI